MSDLLSLLQLPKNDFGDLRLAWDELVSERFFDLLKVEVSRSDAASVGSRWRDYHQYLDEWLNLPPAAVTRDGSWEDTPRLIDVMKRGIHCAEMVTLKAPVSLPTDLATGGDLQTYKQLDPWMVSCVEWLGTPNPPVTQVLVALCDETGEVVTGYIGRLLLETYPFGMAQLVRHPLVS